MSEHDTEAAKQQPSTTVAPTAQPQPAPKTVSLTIYAGFTGLPGTTKTGSIETKEENALWLGLDLQSIRPGGTKAVAKEGLSRGHTTLMTTYDAPVADGEGVGRLAARLKFASDVAKSFDVAIASTLDRKQLADAKTDATRMIVEESRTTGDVVAIASEVSRVLTEKYAQPISVTFSAKTAKVNDVGEREMWYRLHGPTNLHMEVKAVPGGEQTVSSDKTVETASDARHDAEVHGGEEKVQTSVNDVKTGVSKHAEHANSAVEMSWRQEAVQTLTDLTKSFENGREKFTQDIAKKIDDNYRGFNGTHDVSHTTQLSHGDGSSHETSTTEEGDKEKKNFFSHLSDALDVVNVVTAPFGLNPMWKFGLGAGKKISDLFAVHGKVHYTDVSTDGQTHEHGGGTTDVDATHRGHEQRTDKHSEHTKITQTVEKHLAAVAIQLTKATQEVHGTAAIHGASSSGGSATSQNSDSYTATQKQQGAGGSMHTKTHQSNTTTIHYAVTSKETFLHPELEATADGEAELNNAKFPVREQDR